MNRKSFIKSAALAGALCTSFATRVKGATKPWNKSKFYFGSQKVFEVGKPAHIVITPDKNELAKIGDGKDFTIKCVSDEGYAQDGKTFYNNTPSRSGIAQVTSDWLDKNLLPSSTDLMPFKLEKGKIIIETSFMKEGCYSFIMRHGSQKRGRPVYQVYAVNSDLYALRPFKGDTHIHSSVSDGKNPPEEVGLRSLETGCDFQSISDHRRYEGSELLQEMFKDYPISMAVLNAEECHECTVHIHSLFAKSGVIKWIQTHIDEFEDMCKKIYDSLPNDLDNYTRHQVAVAEAQFAVIHNLGGLAGFDHPYWRRGSGGADAVMRYLPDSIIETIFKRKKFDYIEAVNLCAQESTDLNIATMSEMRSLGLDYPVLGNSDAHHVNGQGMAYSIIFAKTTSPDDLKDAILKYQSVAIDHAGDPEFKRPIFVGKKRFISFVWFLLGEYFPKHNELCKQQADVLKKIMKGEDKAANMEKLAELRKKVKDHRGQFFGAADTF